MSDDRKLTDDEFRRIVDDGISKDVRSLKGGRQDLRAARSLLEEFRLSNPQDVPPNLFYWLHDAFGRILAGEAPDAALGMKRGRGQRKRPGKIDPVAIAMFVEFKTRRGVEPARALDDACDYFGREMDTIRAADKEVDIEPDLSDNTLRDYIRDHKSPE